MVQRASLTTLQRELSRAGNTVSPHFSQSGFLVALLCVWSRLVSSRCCCLSFFLAVVLAVFFWVFLRGFFLRGGVLAVVVRVLCRKFCGLV